MKIKHFYVIQCGITEDNTYFWTGIKFKDYEHIYGFDMYLHNAKVYSVNVLCKRDIVKVVRG